MESLNDTRWIQRYDSYHKACARVLSITQSGHTPDSLSELEQEGLVQRFEYTFELAWKVLQDLLIARGYEFVKGPNGTLAQAFSDGLITNHDGWWHMAKARTITSHTYNEGTASEIVKKIFNDYAPLLMQLDETLGEIAEQENV